jgi:hypothetical protein
MTRQVEQVVLRIFDAFCGQIATCDEAVASAERVHLGQLTAAYKLDINGDILAVFAAFPRFDLDKLVKN